MADIYWTDGRIQQLKHLHSEGFSCAEIAGELGCITRSAVIGKIWRLGLNKISPKKTGSSALKRPVAVASSKILHDIKTKNKPAINAKPIKRALPFAGLLNVSLADIGPLQCRWIEGDDGLYCGNETEEGVSWCGYHREVCFTTPSALRDRQNSGVHFSNRRRLSKASVLAASLG